MRAVIIYFARASKKTVEQKRKQIGVSSLKNEEGACQLFVGHYPHDFWTQTRLYPHLRALCFQCAFSMIVTSITFGDDGNMGAKMTSSFQRTGIV